MFEILNIIIFFFFLKKFFFTENGSSDPRVIGKIILTSGYWDKPRHVTRNWIALFWTGCNP